MRDWIIRSVAIAMIVAWWGFVIYVAFAIPFGWVLLALTLLRTADVVLSRRRKRRRAGIW